MPSKTKNNKDRTKRFVAPAARRPVIAAKPAMVAAAKKRLDAHVREMVLWHFNPKTESARSFSG